MSLIAFPFAHPKRAAVAAAWLSSVIGCLPAFAQPANPAPPAPSRTEEANPTPAAPVALPAKAGATIQHIVVEGAQRVEPATVLS